MMVVILLQKLQAWRDECILLCSVAKDHDGYTDFVEDGEANIPVRPNNFNYIR